jgi:predicted ATPase/transcriptional regulator with XRE-family HTH domain
MLSLRTTIGLTQSGLAEYLGVSRRSVGDWEAGNNYPKAEHLKRFIELAVRQRALTHGREEEEIRALWRLAQQKVLLDGAWLVSLLALPQAEALDGTAPPPGPTATPAEDAFTSPTTEVIPTAAEPATRLEAGAGERRLIVTLPSQPTIFLGREAELAEITRTLADPACHLLTLLGPGGVGKTRLAIEVASCIAARISHYQGYDGGDGQDRDVAEAFIDGVVFVPLASVGTPNQIPSSIGEALHLSFAGQQDPTAYLLEYLRDRRMLLVLDNFEHLLDGADVVSRILAGSPHVTILTTSRERLNLRTEWLFDVEGLSYPSEGRHTKARGERAGQPFMDLVNLADYSAMQLFVQRATQVQPGLPLTESNLTTIARISRHVAGMPLALELAAAGVRTLTIDTIEEQIRTNLDVLATTLRDVPLRHRSLRATFDHSWNLLSEMERELFSRLAVFRGGCTVEAAGQVAGGTLQLLEALVDKSLVRQTTAEMERLATSSADRPATEERYLLLEPIREYALEKLMARGELEALQRSHAEYYREIAEAAEAQWNSPTAAAAIARVDRDYDNMRAALSWARDGGDLTTGLRLSAALRRYWQRRGYFSEGRSWLEDLLAVGSDDGREFASSSTDDSSPAAHRRTGANGRSANELAVRLRAIDAAAWLASDQNDYGRAADLFEESRALRPVSGEAEGQSSMLNRVGQARAAGQYGHAVYILEDAVSRQRALRDREAWSTGGLGMTLYELGLLQREQGDFERASALFQESLQFHRELGDREGVAVGLMGLGDIARDQADPTQIRKYCEQSLTICRELGLQWAIGFLLNNLAWAAYLDNDLPKASDLIDESVALFREVHAEASLSEVLITQGHVLSAQGDTAGAYKAMTEALRIVRALGPRLMMPVVLEGIGGVLAGPPRFGGSRTADLPAQRREVNLAVQLLGAAGAMRTQMGTPARPLDKVLDNRELSSARSSLEADSFAQLQEEGERVPLEQLLGTIPSQASFEALPAGPQAP